MTTTTVVDSKLQVIEAYTSFRARVAITRDPVLTEMLRVLSEVAGTAKTHVVYWPKRAIPLDKMRDTCLEREYVCASRDGVNEARFAVLPTEYMNRHRATDGQSGKFGVCRNTQCYFESDTTTTTTYHTDEFIPAGFVTTLHGKRITLTLPSLPSSSSSPAASATPSSSSHTLVTETSKKRARTDDSPALQLRHTSFTHGGDNDGPFIRCVYDDAFELESNRMSTIYARGLLQRYTKDRVAHYSHHRSNSDLRCGYTFTDVLRGRFALKMREIKGVIGIAPGGNNPGPYTIIVSTTAVLQLDTHAQREPNQTPSSYTTLTFMTSNTAGATSQQRRQEVPYTALAGKGVRLSSLLGDDDDETMRGEDTLVLCQIESNDHLVLVYDVYSTENLLLVANDDNQLRCQCNIDYCSMTLWYTAGETVLAYATEILLGSFLYDIAQTRRCYRDANDLQATSPCLRSYKSKRSSVMVNGEFNEKGSFEDDLDTVDLVARVKIHRTATGAASLDATGAAMSMPEFYIGNKALSVRTMRYTTMDTAFADENGGGGEQQPLLYESYLVPSTRQEAVATGSACVHWGLFFYQQPVATFRVDRQRQCVELTPILSGDCYEILRYVIY